MDKHISLNDLLSTADELEASYCAAVAAAQEATNQLQIVTEQRRRVEDQREQINRY